MIFLDNLQKARSRNRSLDQMHLQILVAIPLQMVSTAGKRFLLLRLSFCLFTEIPFEGVIFFFHHTGDVPRNFLVQVVRQHKIVADDRPQKGKCPCPVCQYVKHLQIDPPAVIIDPVKQLAPPVKIDRSAGRLILRLHHSTNIAAVQIIPEQPFAQDTCKMGKISNRSVKCLLKQFTVYFLFQFTCDPENTRIGALRCRWYDLCIVVQFIPLCPCHMLHLSGDRGRFSVSFHSFGQTTPEVKPPQRSNYPEVKLP